MHQYMITSTFGTDKKFKAPVYRTDNLNHFREKVNELKREKGLNNFNSRLILREDITILSYAENGAIGAWLDEPLYIKPIKCLNPFDSKGGLILDLIIV